MRVSRRALGGVEGAQVDPAAGGAALREHVSVELGERPARQAGAHVQAVTVLGHHELERATRPQSRQRHMSEGGLRARDLHSPEDRRDRAHQYDS